MLEKQIEKYLVRRVKDNEGLTFKWISTVTGVPDRLVLLKQQVFFVELKTETGKLSGRQILVFDQLGEQGFPVYILRSYDDIEEFIHEAIKP
jgi:hypothetical protein